MRNLKTCQVLDDEGRVCGVSPVRARGMCGRCYEKWKYQRRKARGDFVRKTEFLPFWDGERELFSELGFEYMGGARGSWKVFKRRVDAWVREYDAEPANVRLTIARPRTKFDRWEVYGLLNYPVIGGGTGAFYVQNGYAESFGEAVGQIDGIVLMLCEKGKMWMEKEKIEYCSIDGCENNLYRKRLCRRHYERQRKYLRERDAEREVKRQVLV